MLQRGRDSSGMVFDNQFGCQIVRSSSIITKLFAENFEANSSYVFGHSRLVTNSTAENQPVVRGDIIVLHNGIVTNEDEIWDNLKAPRHMQIDTECLAALAESKIDQGIEVVAKTILSTCEGSVSAIIVFPKLGKVLLVSNTGSLYYGCKETNTYISSEKYPLSDIGCLEIQNIRNDFHIFDVEPAETTFEKDLSQSRRDLVPALHVNRDEEKLLVYEKNNLKRCSKCILPETMPFIRFDDNGVCNYCNNYVPRNQPKPFDQLIKLTDKYKRTNCNDCIVPFSGGRDSTWGLHIIVNELGLKPITYTYDWGMVTDLGRRNISNMCSKLGVENIVVAADINKKRQNIKKNLLAWLHKPHLGMLNILMAGDKHFFQHVERIKRQTDISLNIWCMNPLEMTHFKAGFLGVPPDFVQERVYSHGLWPQMEYQYKRLSAMCENPRYFNSSLFDTYLGEYYRSIHKKTDYFHLFDYYRWDEKHCDSILKSYGWEYAEDTSTSWRIGDGTAAFYNYIYYTIAGFSEHDTFRSNQIREGQLTRGKALELAYKENRPRYQNIRWYLDTLGMNFVDVINKINAVKRLYQAK